MNIFVRHALAQSHLPHDEPSLLLEGDWPVNLRAPHRDSLDATIDARHAWIDQTASDFAAQLGEDESSDPLRSPYSTGLLANLGALRLRYFFVKLLRWVAYSQEVNRPASGDSWRLFAGPQDASYVALFHELCAAYRIHGEVVSQTGEVAPPVNSTPAIAPWRRWLTPFVANTTLNTIAPNDSLGRRVLLCGDAHLLAPLGSELTQRGHRIAWLSDEPILKLKLRMRRVPQLVCESSRAAENRFAPVEVQPLRTEQRVDLSAAVRPWLEQARAQHGARWTRWLQAIELHCSTFRPDTLVLGEDATPFSRAATLVARRQGVRSVVVQHGAPCIRFGFAPLLADQVAAWDEASREQLAGWGVDSQRIAVTGSLALDQSQARIAQGKPFKRRASTRTILWLASLPARDDRPDAVEYHLTSATHAAMLQNACALLASVQNARVIIRPHPRDEQHSAWRSLLERFPTLDARLQTGGHWTDSLAQADAVLSCGSSAGLEAARLGWPVVQLLPEGSADLLPAARWGVLGTARDAKELRGLLERALRTPVRRETQPSHKSAAVRIADFVEHSPGGKTPHARQNIAHEELLCLPT
jgi:hypothetical protein